MKIPMQMGGVLTVRDSDTITQTISDNSDIGFNVLANNAIIIGAYSVDGSHSYVCIPYINLNGYWRCQIRNNDSSLSRVPANTSVKVKYKYLTLDYS